MDRRHVHPRRPVEPPHLMTAQRARPKPKSPSQQPGPYDVDAERLLLATALTYREVAHTVATVTVPIFTVAEHQDLAHLIERVVAADEPVDIATMHVWAAKLGVSSRAGDVQYLLELQTSAVNSSVAPPLIERLTECALARKVLLAAGDVVEGARSVNGWRQAVSTLAELATFELQPNSGSDTLGVIDLAAHLANGIPPPRFVHPWLYAGALTLLSSEPGVGKTWVAEHLAATVMEAGYSAVYVDVDSTAEVVAERLAALQVDHELISERFVYANPTGARWTDADLLLIRGLLDGAGRKAPQGLGLVVIDALADVLTAADLDEDRAPGVTQMLSGLARVVRPTGAALLVLDHLAKPSKDGPRTRSRYGRGSGAKLAKADAALLLETQQEFSVGKSGELRLWVTKDRRGRLPLPRLGRPGLRVEVAADNGAVSLIERGEDADEHGEWTGPTSCMEAVLAILDGDPAGQYSQRRLIDTLRAAGQSFRTTTIRTAAERLVLDGRCHAVAGSRGSRLYSATPDAQRGLDDQF